jgi:hypothetical protein
LTGWTSRKDGPARKPGSPPRLAAPRSSIAATKERRRFLFLDTRLGFEDNGTETGRKRHERVYLTMQGWISVVITAFDRLVFRGNLGLNHEAGTKGYLWAKGIAWKDYAKHQRVKQSAGMPGSLSAPGAVPYQR